MPYALIVAVRSVLSGTLLTSFGFPAGFARFIGMAVMDLIVSFVNKYLVTASPVRLHRIGMLEKRMNPLV